MALTVGRVLGAPIADRVRRLREEARLSQTELAEKAEIAPAVLSRILAGEREVRMEHVLQIARALNVSVPALVGGTDAESVFYDWVPRAQYESCEKERIENTNCLATERAEGKARDAEIESLRGTVDAQARRIEQLETAVAQRAAVVQAAEVQREELTSTRIQLERNNAEQGRLSALVGQLQATLTIVQAQRDAYATACNDLRSRVGEVQQQLAAHKTGAPASHALAVLLGGFAGAALATSGGSRRRGA
jgi:transcriptional regulator with XRE-family HTH domain